MNCDEMKALIHDYIDGELDAVEEFEDHLSKCSHCRLEYQFMLDMIRQMNTIESLEVPKTLHRSIMNQIEIEASKKKSTSLKHNIKNIFSVVAAAFLLVVVFAVVQPNQFLDKSTESIMMDTTTDSSSYQDSETSSDTTSDSVMEETVESSRATGSMIVEEDKLDTYGLTNESNTDVSNDSNESSDMMGIMGNDINESIPAEEQPSEETTIETETNYTGDDTMMALDKSAPIEDSELMITLEDPKTKQDLSDQKAVTKGEEFFKWLPILIPGILVLLVAGILIIRRIKTKQ